MVRLMPPRRRPRPLARGWSGRTIVAVGHSTRTADELIALLEAFEVKTLVDIRTVPRSRRIARISTIASAWSRAMLNMREAFSRWRRITTRQCGSSSIGRTASQPPQSKNLRCP